MGNESGQKAVNFHQRPLVLSFHCKKIYSFPSIFVGPPTHTITHTHPGQWQSSASSDSHQGLLMGGIHQAQIHPAAEEAPPPWALRVWCKKKKKSQSFFSKWGPHVNEQEHLMLGSACSLRQKEADAGQKVVLDRYFQTWDESQPCWNALCTSLGWHNSAPDSCLSHVN